MGPLCPHVQVEFPISGLGLLIRVLASLTPWTVSFCITHPCLESPGLIWDIQPEGGQGESFLLSMSRSLALTQKRDQRLNCFFQAPHQGSSAFYCRGGQQGPGPKEPALPHPFCLAKGDMVSGTGASKFCQNTTTEMSEARAGIRDVGTAKDPTQRFLGPILAGHSHKTQQEG